MNNAEKDVSTLGHEWELGRRGLTEDELAEFRSIYNEQFVALGREKLEARGFTITTSPCAFSFDCPVDEQRRCTVTVISPAAEWSPAAVLNPRRMANILENLEEQLEEIRVLADTGGDRNLIRDQAWSIKHAISGVQVVADEAADDLLKIPGDAALDGVALVYDSADENEATA